LIAPFVIMAIAVEEALVGHARIPYPWQIPWNVPVLVLLSTAIFWWPGIRRSRRWVLLPGFVVAWAIIAEVGNRNFVHRARSLGDGSVILGGLETVGMSVAIYAVNVLIYLGLIWLVDKAIDVLFRRGQRDAAAG
jgi:hypothetical protein